MTAAAQIPANISCIGAVETDCILLSGSHGAAGAGAVAVAMPNVRINLILLTLIGRMGLF